jgi:acyl-CoA synthetase (AMP-forming)/AMP-acid ligase II
VEEIGVPISSTEVTIRDDAGRDLELGEIGEICVRGPQVMRGYWNRPDETAKVMMPDGFLRTGDVGHMDERGFVYIEDRKKDMILVSGFNVYPNEVEAVVATHPGVLEAAAVAQPDEHSGEVVRGPQGSDGHGEGYYRALPTITGRLQGSEAHLFQVGAAKVECGEDSEEVVERRSR